MSADDPTDGRDIWFEVDTPRVQHITYRRRIQARDEVDALAIIAEGTAWPSSYDDVDGEIYERGETVVTRIGACRHEDRHEEGHTCFTCERAARRGSAEEALEMAEFLARGVALNMVSPIAIPCRLCLAKPGEACTFAPGPPLIGGAEFHPFRVRDAEITTRMIEP